MEKKTRVLFVLNQYPNLDGITTVTNSIVDYLLKKDFEVYCLSFPPDHYTHRVLPLENIFYFPTLSNVDENSQFYNSLVVNKGIELIVNQAMYLEPTKIVFNPDRNAQIQIYSFLHDTPGSEQQALWRRKIKLLKDPFGLLFAKLKTLFNGERNFRSILSPMEQTYRICTEGSERVVFLCQEYIPDFIERYRLYGYKEKCLTIPNPSRYSDVNVDLSEKENVVVFVGRLNYQKDIYAIIRIWELISDSHCWNLKIVGDGELKEELIRYADQLKVKRIEFVGATSAPEFYYSKAKIMMLTSRYEGFPMCLIEAQQFGVVPIAFNSSKGVESILKNDMGILIEKGNERLFAETLNSMIADPDKLLYLQKNIMSRPDDYSIEKIGYLWSQILRS